MNVFLFMILSLFGGSGSDKALDDCGNLKVTYDMQALGDKVTINVQARGGKEPYFYIFFDQKNNPLTWDVKQHSCVVDKDDLPKFVNVLDSNGCSKRIDINETSAR
jgi:hypothetical protein